LYGADQGIRGGGDEYDILSALSLNSFLWSNQMKGKNAVGVDLGLGGVYASDVVWAKESGRMVAAVEIEVR